MGETFLKPPDIEMLRFGIYMYIFMKSSFPNMLSELGGGLTRFGKDLFRSKGSKTYLNRPTTEPSLKGPIKVLVVLVS